MSKLNLNNITFSFSPYFLSPLDSSSLIIMIRDAVCMSGLAGRMELPTVTRMKGSAEHHGAVGESDLDLAE